MNINDHSMILHPSENPTKMSLNIGDLTMVCSGEYAWGLAIWPYIPSGGGKVEIDIIDTSAFITLDVNVDNNGYPDINVQSSKVDTKIGKIRFSGNIILDVLNIFEIFIRGTLNLVLNLFGEGLITDILENTVNDLLKSLPLNANVGELLESLLGDLLPIGDLLPNLDQIEADLTFNVMETITYYINAKLAAEFFVVGGQDAYPYEGPVRMPEVPFDKFFNIQLSTYTLNTLLYRF